MILCDLCGQVKECLHKEIDGKEFDICADCWAPAGTEVEGQGAGQESAGDGFPAAATGTGARTGRAKTLTRPAAENFWWGAEGELASWFRFRRVMEVSSWFLKEAKTAGWR